METIKSDDMYQTLVRTGAHRTVLHCGEECKLGRIHWKSLVTSTKFEWVYDCAIEMRTGMILLHGKTQEFH